MMPGTRFCHSLLLAAWILASVMDVYSQSPEPELSLGEVARRNAKPSHPERVITEEDLRSASGFVRVSGLAAMTRPYTWFRFLVPRDMKRCGGGVEVLCGIPLPNGGLVNLIGGAPQESRSCTTIDCAEAVLFQLLLPRRLGFKAKETVRTTTSIDGFPARIVRVVAQNSTITKQGLAVFIQTPGEVIELACLYQESDFDPAHAMCETITDSLTVELPKHYRVLPKNEEY